MACLSASYQSAPPLYPPLVLEHAGKRLVVRLVLHEQGTERSPMLLQSLGLTARQAEVLFWVAHGKSNAEVGTMLGLRVGTVRKHLEHVYTQLGMENRSAAMCRALEVLGLPAGASSDRRT